MISVKGKEQKRVELEGLLGARQLAAALSWERRLPGGSLKEPAGRRRSQDKLRHFGRTLLFAFFS